MSEILTTSVKPIFYALRAKFDKKLEEGAHIFGGIKNQNLRPPPMNNEYIHKFIMFPEIK